MVDETATQVARWRGGKQVDLAHEMMELTLAIAGRTLFGADVRGDAAAVVAGLELAMHAQVANLTLADPARLRLAAAAPPARCAARSRCSTTSSIA